MSYQTAVEFARLLQPIARHGKGHIGPGDGGRARAAVSLKHITIERHGALSQNVHVRYSADAAADQSLNFMRASGWTTAASRSLRTLLRCAWEHRVFRGD